MRTERRIRALDGDSVLSQRAAAEPSILIGARDGPALSGCGRARIWSGSWC